MTGTFINIGESLYIGFIVLWIIFLISKMIYDNYTHRKFCELSKIMSRFNTIRYVIRRDPGAINHREFAINTSMAMEYFKSNKNRYIAFTGDVFWKDYNNFDTIYNISKDKTQALLHLRSDNVFIHEFCKYLITKG